MNWNQHLKHVLLWCLTIGLTCWSMWCAPVSAQTDDSHETAYASSAKHQTLTITGIQMDADGQTIQIQATQPFAESQARYYSMIKLPSPLRMVIDIPDATFLLPKSLMKKEKAILPIHQNGITEIEVSQTQTQFYKAVRLIVYVDDAKTLWQLNSSLQDNTMRISMTPPSVLPPSTSKQPLPPPPPQIGALSAKVQSAITAESVALPTTAGKNVLESLVLKDEHLELKAAEGGSLRIKNRFTLNQPDRLVLDLENTVVSDKSLLRSITPDTAGLSIRQIRVGQFDENTVRIVVETNQPELVQAVYPGIDRRLITIGLNTEASVAALPADTVLGELQEVVVGKREGDSVIRLSASAPIVHRLTRTGDKVTLELLNVAAKSGSVSYDATAFPELESVKTEALAATQPNSKLIVDLKNAKGLEVETELSYDGKTMDVVLLPAARLLQIGQASKAPYPAKIVIDAGHGGKDLGANREGVNEKDLNLQVAHLLRQELEKRGFKVYMTRSTDVFLPLSQITSITNSIHPDLFVSVHQNSSTNSGLNGIETYYYTPQSLALAKKVHQKMVNYVDSPDRGVRKAMFYVIHHTPVPAILCEVGYISNPAERRELQSRARQQKTAFAISEGVVEYLKSKISAQARPSR